MSMRHSVNFPPPLPSSFLIGIQKYSLQRCLNELQQEGFIIIEGKHIQIVKALAIDNCQHT